MAATTAAYVALVVVFAGPMLIWLGRNAPFGYSVVRSALLVNPLAAALHVMETPGFREYENLVPANWWIMGALSLLLLVMLSLQTWRLSRPA